MNTCSQCGNSLTKKEIMTRDLFGPSMCDICLGKKRRAELAKEGYQKRLQTVPRIYVETKFGDKALSSTHGKSAVIMAEESPVTGTQWVWDAIKYYWKSGLNAVYISAKDMGITYSSLPWQARKDFIDGLIATPGMLAIDDVDYSANKEVISRIIEHRAERGQDTVIVIHVPYEDLDKVIGEKAESLVKSRWKCLAMERP